MASTLDFVGVVTALKAKGESNTSVLQLLGFQTENPVMDSLLPIDLAGVLSHNAANIHPGRLFMALRDSAGLDIFDVLRTVVPKVDGVDPPIVVLPQLGPLPLDEGLRDRINYLPPQLAAMAIDGLLNPPRQRDAALQDFAGGAVAAAIEGASKILVLTGAGISTSCGIPDFRSAGGVYSIVGDEFPELRDRPEKLFSIDYFKQNARPFFEFNTKMVNGLNSGTYRPSVCHRFIAELERRGKLLRQYTQNIDTLEKYAGVSRFIACHGSFATVSCTRSDVCGVAGQDADSVAEALAASTIPRCPKCQESPPPSLNKRATEATEATEGEGGEADADADAGAGPGRPDGAAAAEANVVCELFDQGVLKHDIVMFGEPLPKEFFANVQEDCSEADLVIVIGTSLQVGPVNRIIDLVKPDVPQILINREVVAPGHNFDSELLGDCDEVVHLSLIHI